MRAPFKISAHHQRVFERFDPAFHARLGDAFRDIARRDPRRCRLIDASGDAETVAARAIAAITSALDARRSTT